LSNPRIISGSAKGIRLEMVPGNTTRPITDRVKEALFNIIGGDIIDSTFLDLFGGTGSVGIEALSRSAKYVKFIEISPIAQKTINKNLLKTKLSENAEVVLMDAAQFIETMDGESFDYVFIAPPQYKGIWLDIMYLLDKFPHHVTNDGWIIIQIDPIENIAIEMNNFDKIDERKYGSTLLIFFQKRVLV